MVRIRLKRIGKRQQSFYRVVVVDGRHKRDGLVLEDLGYYQPWLKSKKSALKTKRYLEWVKKGAIPTPTVTTIFKRLSKSASATDKPAVSGEA